MRNVPAFLVIAAALAPGAVLAAPGAPRAADLDAAVYAEVPKGFSGGVLVARKGAVILDRGYGDGIGPDTRFWIASVAKQFVAAAILDRVDHGTIELADPIARFFPDAPADKREITVQELLAHTSGLAPADVAENAADRAAAVRAIFAQPLAGPRGVFRYANDNYQLAAAIVEVVTEEPYRESAKELWQAAKLLYTGFAGEPGTKVVASARGATPDRLSRKSWGPQGVFSTARDLWRWYAALRGGRVISAGSVERMFRGVAPIGEGEAGLGWFIGREPGGAAYYFTRGYEDWGPNALMYAYPESEVVVIILTHAGDANAELSWSRAMLAKLLPMLR